MSLSKRHTIKAKIQTYLSGEIAQAMKLIYCVPVKVNNTPMKSSQGQHTHQTFSKESQNGQNFQGQHRKIVLRSTMEIKI